MKRSFLGFTILILALVACGINSPASPPTEIPTLTTNVATPQILAAATPTENPTLPVSSTATSDANSLTPDGETVSVGGITFLIPNGMASDATSTITGDVEYPYINPSGGNMPQHIKFTLNNYAAQQTLLQPQIIVFKTAEYTQYSDLTAGIINELQSLNYVDGQPLSKNLSGPTFTAQIQALKFQNGHGIRYLTQVDQAPMPANNHEMFYYFQGLTSDGQFYIQAVLPTQVAYLPADGNPNTPLPANGIPFNDDFLAYMNAVTQKLNATGTFSFTPYLDHLDSMMESLSINGF